MFDEKPEILAAVETLSRLAEPMERGQVLTWDAMQKATGWDRSLPHFKTAFGRFRKDLLRQRSIALRPINGVGFKLLTHQEQVRRCAEDRHRKMFRQSQKAIREVEAVDGAILSDHDRRLQVLQLGRLVDERRTIRRSIKECVVSPGASTETLPRRQVPTT